MSEYGPIKESQKQKERKREFLALGHEKARSISASKTKIDFYKKIGFALRQKQLLPYGPKSFGSFSFSSRLQSAFKDPLPHLMGKIRTKLRCLYYSK
jgi:hypothetical protein